MTQNSPQNPETIISEGYQVKIGEYLDTGWNICKQQLGLFVGFLVIQIIISISLGQIDEKIGAPVSFLISAPLNAGFFIAALQILKKKSTVIEDFFKGFKTCQFKEQLERFMIFSLLLCSCDIPLSLQFTILIALMTRKLQLLTPEAIYWFGYT